MKGGVALCPFRQFNFTYEDVSNTFEECFRRIDGEFKNHLHVLGRSDAQLSTRKPFPRDLVMIGFQYAMSDDVFYHSFLFHELGHHLFAETYEASYRDLLFGELSQKLGALDIDDLLRLFPEGRPRQAAKKAVENSDLRRLFIDATATQYVKPLLRWANELFADAFAIALAGPQYGLAFGDLTGPLGKDTTFTKTHPARLLRQHQQWDMMQRVCWAQGATGGPGKQGSSTESKAGLDAHQSFESMAKEIFTRIRPGKDIAAASSDLAFPHWDDREETVLREAVAALIEARPKISEDAERCAGDAKARRDEFWQLGERVLDMFESAVVPSTIISEVSLGEVPSTEFDMSVGDAAQNKTWIYRPGPCTVMNVARLLYETGCRRLLCDWPATKKPKEKVFRVHSRLSDWTQKAIADWLLVQSGEKAE